MSELKARKNLLRQIKIKVKEEQTNMQYNIVKEEVNEIRQTDYQERDASTLDGLILDKVNINQTNQKLPKKTNRSIKLVNKKCEKKQIFQSFLIAVETKQ
jgi:hypothetical protein